MKSYSIDNLVKKGRLWRLGTLIGLLFLALLLAIGLLTGCPEDSNGTNGVNGANGTAPPPQEFPMTVTDQADRMVNIEAEPQKIISLAPSNTEITYALGLEDRLVGVTTYCNYPEAALDKPKVGGYSTVEIEALVGIQPDLILAAKYHVTEVVPELERLGLTVIVLYPVSFDDVLEGITLVGKCTGSEDEASQLVTEMRSRVKVITDQTSNLTETKRARVFYVVRHDPLWTAGSDTLIHELIEMAGGINIFQDLTGYKTVGLETVIAANPQVMIAGTQMGGATPAFDFLKTDDRLADVDARINDCVYQIDVDIVSRPGPRLVNALELLARMIQPEIFGTDE